MAALGVIVAVTPVSVKVVPVTYTWLEKSPDSTTCIILPDL